MEFGEVLLIANILSKVLLFAFVLRLCMPLRYYLIVRVLKGYVKNPVLYEEGHRMIRFFVLSCVIWGLFDTAISLYILTLFFPIPFGGG